LTSKEIIINEELATPDIVWGPMDVNLKIIQSKFQKIKIVARGITVNLKGTNEEIERFEFVFQQLLIYLSRYGNINEVQLIGLIDRNYNYSIQEEKKPDNDQNEQQLVNNDIILHGNGGKIIKAKTPNQRMMVEAINKNDILFAIGPAGTGKTYTAVALAVKALKNREIKRIILARPAVEAGENLGFLPGDLKEKIDPYLRPLYDALDDMIAPEKLKQHIENRVIEIAPMAFMRGRTLDHAYVILDEAQNATDLQLKMFLTRMGPNAKFIITGDLTQIDLPKNSQSGLLRAVKILEGIDGIAFTFLTFEDVVRHKLVKNIIKAYDHLNQKV
jgi:phosphate starvation-inducible PhoH-like protein